jgi:hypothetical protein
VFVVRGLGLVVNAGGLLAHQGLLEALKYMFRVSMKCMIVHVIGTSQAMECIFSG